jgi:alkylated DNA repair dioxygenase AlkB
LQLIKTFYSAFASTNLLTTLRAKLVTELYICGCTTNLSAFATAMDAARHGIRITLIDDCLGYRKKERHDMAIEKLRELMGARVMSCAQVLDRLKNPPPFSDDEDDEDEDEDSEIMVGEDADHAPIDPLAVDSDEEDEEQEGLIPSTVRASSVAIRRKPCLPQARISVERKPIEHGEPSHPRGADQGDGGSVGDTARTDSRDIEGRRKEEVYWFDGWIGRATARRSSVSRKDESSENATTYMTNNVANEEEVGGPNGTMSTSMEQHEPSTGVEMGESAVDPSAPVMVQSDAGDQIANSNAQTSRPLFGDDKAVESAGSKILYDLLPPELSQSIFDKLNAEITWQKMHHQTGEVPRLVCCQGSIDYDGSMPVYRHPSDQTMPIESWTPVVDEVRKAAEIVVGHPLNHALIQLYRSGNDYISEHSDKTLDVVKGSSIVNVSFGAQRTMRLRTKRTAALNNGNLSSLQRTTYRVPMPHNSMITMSLETNAEYLHGINADKRPGVELLEAEKAYGGQRISLTFRNIGTFLNRDSSRIWGQGTTAVNKDDAKAVINSDPFESEKLVRAFGMENQATSIDWDRIYGEGFDVLNLK